MRKHCFQKYPALKGEILAFSRGGNQGGVVAFLLDPLIDIDSLGFKEGNEEPMDQNGQTGSRTDVYPLEDRTSGEAQGP